MVRNHYSPPPSMTFLLDAGSRVVWASYLSQPYTSKQVIGHLAWANVAPPHDKTVQSAILLATATAKPQMVDVTDTLGSTYRAWYMPAKLGKVRTVVECIRLPEAVSRLTDREVQVCKLLATGAAGKEVSRRLGIRRTTLDNHRRNIAAKLGIPTPSLVAWAAAHQQWF